MQIKIKNRLTHEVMFTETVEDNDTQPFRTVLERLVGRNASLRYAMLHDQNFENAHLQGADLRNTNFIGANLQNANLRGVNLQYANLQEASLRGANLQRANLQGANLQYANLQGVDFIWANLQDANFQRTYLQGANLQNADLRYVDFIGANFQGADFQGANLRGANLQGANLSGADFFGANLKEVIFQKLSNEDHNKFALTYRAEHPEVPVIENLDAKILARIEANPSCFDMGGWHCGTTHCRAGHAIDLAEEAGYALEKKSSPENAGRMIYLASTGRVPDFFDLRERALEDLRKCVAGKDNV